MKSIALVFLMTILTGELIAKPRILMLGDSLTAGYGIEKSKAYPALVEEALRGSGFNEVVVINAGVSGDTTAGGLSRLPWLIKKKSPTHMLVCLGGNDGLRGLNLEQSQKNLASIIELAQKNKLPILIAGMQIPPNYGPEYTSKFRSMYPDLSKRFKIPLIPFLLEGVAGEGHLNLPDKIHPNEKGHEIISKTVLPFVKALINE